MKPGQLGFKWPEEIKEKIRQSCLKYNHSIWKEKRIEASNKACNKKVICITTGKEYKSESEAARELGLKPSQISRVCLGERNTVHKLSFRFKNA